ncbi:MAG: hypothetical protein ACHQK9_15425 [Reyranellales bacterium]
MRSLSLKGNPFEHYTAETEPDIASYAVRPPYLQAISDRVEKTSSFILFGDRGAGKSATRITVYSEVWKKISAASHSEALSPFVVTLTDFSAIIAAFNPESGSAGRSSCTLGGSPVGVPREVIGLPRLG